MTGWFSSAANVWLKTFASAVRSSQHYESHNVLTFISWSIASIVVWAIRSHEWLLLRTAWLLCQISSTLVLSSSSPALGQCSGNLGNFESGSSPSLVTMESTFLADTLLADDFICAAMLLHAWRIMWLSTTLHNHIISDILCVADACRDAQWWPSSPVFSSTTTYSTILRSDLLDETSIVSDKMSIKGFA